MVAKSTVTGLTGTTGWTGTSFTRSSMTYDGPPPSTHVRTYNWPPLQLNFWIFVILLASRLNLSLEFHGTSPIALFYFITVGSLSILFILGIFWLIAQRRLLPAIVMVGGFMFFILWLVGLVVVAIQLFGPDGSIQSVCDVQVFGKNPKGTSMATMAWLQQRNICQSWQLVFAMALTGTVFFVWVMIMAYQVFVNS
ncbi:hypothetical protein FOC1_g10002761 [Fusarium oxysporum f. sp. cubense race 1]|uniref:MARVEL domain-containing protein n=1 Tax=Fusarium oxysporum f. sp. cubense (strain race 1) TaxID=1229664 RepID=N4TWA6_FUSC1|nr:hypothetical protein FOC1_g10002761 [Fusarium oxysporum f. sp. cubense race 1]